MLDNKLTITKKYGIILKLFPYGIQNTRRFGLVSESTINQKNMLITRVLLPFLDSIHTDYSKLESILAGVREFFSYRYNQFARNTLRRDKSFVLSWLSLNYPHHVNEFHIFFRDFHIPESGVEKSDKSIEFKDLSDIISKVKNTKHRLFIRFLYYSGARVSEMLHLKLKDGSLSRDKLEVIFKTTGKGNRDRTIRITKEIYDEILNVFDSKSKENSRGYLFYNKQKNSPTYSRNYIFKITKSLGNFSCHNLRHSRATNLIDEGVPLNSVSEFLGHSSVLTTAKFYLHNRPKAFQLMNKVL